MHRCDSGLAEPSLRESYLFLVRLDMVEALVQARDGHAIQKTKTGGRYLLPPLFVFLCID